MLVSLHISNLALIDNLLLEFEPGLNLLTGETGSGKSIIVDSLGLLIGGRSSGELIKSGKQTGFVEGLFSLKFSQHLELLLEEAGLKIETEPQSMELLIRREFSTTGRNRVFINNQMATQSFLRSIGPHLADIHGQGDQQALFRPEKHLDLFDSYAGLAGLLPEVALRYKTWSQLRRNLSELRTDEAKRLQMLDMLRFQVDELRLADLRIDEDLRLEEEKRRLNNVERLSAITTDLFSKLYEDNDAVVTRISRVEKQIAELSEFDASFAEYNEGLATAISFLEDIAFAVREFYSGLEFSPERLVEVEERLAEIARYKRKYGGSVQSALAHLANSEEKLQLLEDSSTREAELENKLKIAAEAYLDVAKKVHQSRLEAKIRFEKQMEQELASLAMEKTCFVANFAGDPENETSFTDRGYTQLEFYFSANPGEPPRPLAKIASGGEASRLMLVLKTIARESGSSGTAIFDEVDAGIGGRVAEAVGRRLKKLALSEQVLCVTHHPQVAALADHHYYVVKSTDGKQTTVTVEKLSASGRIEELARMLTGSTVTETARKHASELLHNQPPI